MAFAELLNRTASKYNVKYAFEGHSFVCEGIAPLSEFYFDGQQTINVEEEYRKLGTAPGYCHHCETGLCPVGVTTQLPDLEKRLQPDWGERRLRNYLQTLNMELTTLARACGKSNVHHLEREDLVALTVESAAMAKVPLAGTDWIPGAKGV